MVPTNLPIKYKNGIYRLRTKIKQSNLHILSDKIQAIHVALQSILVNRSFLEEYIFKNPVFLYALTPVKVSEDSPKIIKLAAEAAETVGVGPMAAVPGALAELAVESMKPYSFKVSLVENGGEIAADSKISLKVGVYAGFSPISGKIGFKLKKEDSPVGLATSSATVSHALSFGEADAVIVFSGSATLSDAVATAVCNIVRGKDVEASIQKGLEKAESIHGVRGALIVRDRMVGRVGKLPEVLWLKGSLEDMFEAAGFTLI